MIHWQNYSPHNKVYILRYSETTCILFGFAGAFHDADCVSVTAFEILDNNICCFLVPFVCKPQTSAHCLGLGISLAVTETSSVIYKLASWRVLEFIFDSVQMVAFLCRGTVLTGIAIEEVVQILKKLCATFILKKMF